MKTICAYSCLLFAVSFVEMKPLSITGHVGKSVEIKCSDWDAWTDVKHNVKYFCDSPCTEDKHIIVKAEFGKTKKYKNRIEVTNSAEGFFVTLTNLQESDSNTYYCGAEKFGRDSYIKVNLKVTKAESSSPKTTPKKVTAGPTLSCAVTDDSITSSNSSDNMTDVSTSQTTLNTMLPTASATGGAGHAPYLILGVIVLTATLVVLLKFMCKMMKQLKVVSSAGAPQEDAQEGVEYDEIRPETLTDPDCLYANYSYQQHTELTAESSSKDVSSNSASRCEVSSRGPCAESRGTDPQCDLVYSVAQLPKVQIEPTGQSESNQFAIENDSFHSLAQLPQAT
ncbi:CMRF35-like molecule 9 [Epinephelus fuscoguttatus]|uniref:CMRF35-like molecule 9 n=1 Tax=Epinephelus fuscoguttatus TaxID=293821 RepID=UPI0020D1BB28|nr:CMRF35-like molecule 9 [Epinephelus fuscoguttatus]XP_049427970.1 CMRF35-like molecule 9 [Epinephelus fuscoguttatus]